MPNIVVGCESDFLGDGILFLLFGTLLAVMLGLDVDEEEDAECALFSGRSVVANIAVDVMSFIAGENVFLIQR